MSLAKEVDYKITETDYLDGERISDIKHEYIDGVVYAMAGASSKHNIIAKNISFLLESSLREKNLPCDVFSSDMKVKIAKPDISFFYPDVMLVCDSDDEDSYYQNSPLIIVEVLSQSTRRNDFTTKMMHYFNIASLEEYVLIEQNICQVQVYRKNDHWKASSYFPGDTIHFASINTSLSVEDIYYHINNDDIVKYLKEKEDNIALNN